MSPLPADLLIPIRITTAGAAQVPIEFIRPHNEAGPAQGAAGARARRIAPAIVIALAQLLTGTPASLAQQQLGPAGPLASGSRGRRTASPGRPG